MKKLLILQFRHDEEVFQEQSCFLAEFSSYIDQIEFVNAIEQDLPDQIDQYAGIIVSGSARYYLSDSSDDKPWVQKVFNFLAVVIEKDIPVLGICFGFQMIALQQGAKVIRDEHAKQSGTFIVTRFETAKDDELLGHLPTTHAGLFAHQDVVVELPDHIIPYCRTERVECSSFRLAGKRVWGTLYHPELNGKRVVERIKLLPGASTEGYMGEKSEKEILELFYETPEAVTVLHRFAEIVFSSAE